MSISANDWRARIGSQFGMDDVLESDESDGVVGEALSYRMRVPLNSSYPSAADGDLIFWSGWKVPRNEIVKRLHFIEYSRS
jgi:hypothetical protein